MPNREHLISCTTAEASAGWTERRPLFDQARAFRAIGQDLERKNISTFCLQLTDSGYWVRGLLPLRRTLWGKFTKKSADETMEISYSPDDIERLDGAGRSRRGAHHGLPDFLGLSQQLRAVGALVDRRGGRICRLERIAYDGMIPSVAVEFVNPNGTRTTEEYNARHLYDYCVRMYKTRSSGVVFSSASAA